MATDYFKLACKLLAPKEVIFSTFALQARYRKQEAGKRVYRLVQRQIRMMCVTVPGRLGHARWIAREVAAVKAIRDSR